MLPLHAPIGNDFPGGFDVKSRLQESLGSASPVLEVGCGVGRLAALFQPADYVGVDINPAAIHVARGRLPDYRFGLYDISLNLPKAPTAFFYTVLLHVPDDELWIA